MCGEKMDLRLLTLLVVGCTYAAPANDDNAENAVEQAKDNNDDLKTAASTLYSDRYPDWSRGYPNGNRDYGIMGYGTLDDRYYNSAGGYANTYGGYDGGYSRGRSYGGYGNPEGGYRNGYNSGSRYGDGGNYGYSSVNDYGETGYYGGGSGYGGYAGNNVYSYGANGGYGGYAGNGGLTSYYGYNNPSYPGGYHLGYGYYNKKPGYGNIYNSGITPSLVTGYRGYSKK
ncbi:hypothetical protein K1T71_004462 [Dendrolimus kikuchii]|uniref:Uncharacterized protein n=1 Tax=Dendrolimus kikuchii TaxID=765133 RepID=A0ACC1D7R6_9NEOP|nr:hypothetical protein K1T71_004462 [Dendrolimus kikuchii]